MRKRKEMFKTKTARSNWKWSSIATMSDRSWLTVSFLTPLFFRYHLPLTFLSLSSIHFLSPFTFFSLSCIHFFLLLHSFRSLAFILVLHLRFRSLAFILFLHLHSFHSLPTFSSSLTHIFSLHYSWPYSKYFFSDIHFMFTSWAFYFFLLLFLYTFIIFN